MFRRRRPTREIPFNLDCFLDVITNVVGIIIRLIIVAWVGGRAYHALQHALPPAPELPSVVSRDDIVQKTLSRQQQELSENEKRLQAQQLRLDQLRVGSTTTAEQLAKLAEEEKQLLKERHDLIAAQVALELANKKTTIDEEKLKAELKQLEDEVRKVEQAPSAKKPLRYHTPVSQVVDSEELHFECKDGRVTFIDLAVFLTDLRRDVQERSKDLRAQRRLDGVANPVGAFELHYTLELDEDNASVSAGWRVVPIAPVRGETEAAALQPNSTFRQIVDRLLPEHTTVTFWVYPESFGLYRQLRDYLHQKNIEVAGRPLPAGHPIASSRDGRRSRGQ